MLTIQIVKQIRRVIAVCLLAAIVVLTGIPSAQALPKNEGDRGSDVTRASDTTYKGKQVIKAEDANANPLTQKTIKQIQSEAEDLGDSPERPIGDTGLDNIRELGKNIPETIRLKARQTKEIYTPDAQNPIEKVKDKIGNVIDSIK